ncbi:Arm DNA-binding domain-containing protein [Gilliamella sp. wkB112]|uniref:Arm DNA-binding domain-containing protein n=1 Tax=Gilliamella sp. wkB112 TaxID=3120257 RepID=UPI00080E5FD7|nr:Arm DNA-binding domain-containing protein [Gilliamella apicola]OCG05269.1 hypothetical protein A9G12_05960 [Gilliamella apicola]
MSLTDLKIKSAKPNEKQYKLTDGDGLFLLVYTNGSKYWRYRYKFQRKECLLAIGTYPTVSLSETRSLRDETKSLLAENIDPLIEKKAKQLEDEIQVTMLTKDFSILRLGTNHQILRPTSSSFFMPKSFADKPCNVFSLLTNINPNQVKKWIHLVR